MSLKIRCILVVVVGVVLGLTVSIGSSVLASRNDAGLLDRDRRTVSELELLADVIDHVRREYVDVVDEEQLVASAIRGVIAELDKHSRYLDPNEYAEIQISAAGNYAGVGLDITVDEGKVTVIAPIDGTPAQRAGILPGDVVVSVDDVPIGDGDIDDAVSRMRGQPGTEVTVGVHRDGEQEALRFALTRSTIQVQTVRGRYLGDGIGYMKITGFSDTTAADLTRVTEALEAQADGDLEGLVVDLRNNPGGVLDAAVAVADAFLDDGLIVRGSGRAGDARFERHAQPGDELERIDVVLLVNSGSASASEIVAGALKAHDRATVVGERTYGKASVQTVMPLAEGRAIKLTTSRYYTASGRSINGTGIEPDIIVRADNPRALFGSRGVQIAPTDDNQLQTALGVLERRSFSLSRAR
ncbi:MAG: PDZ domain-containing protein [Gammaproteobacteria bacterium]|nr:PDZ domain-containing protein [Gammaproteobacteria bacterium]